jgi:predicted enzyme related to lactoylglutathione lyase
MKLNIKSVAFILYVRDVSRTERFYTEHLGIQFARNEGEDGSLWLLAKIGNEVEMLVFPGDPKPGNTPGIVFGLGNGGIETAIASLASAGVEIVTPVSEAPGGWSADFKDPDGHTVSFYQDASLPKT